MRWQKCQSKINAAILTYTLLLIITLLIVILSSHTGFIRYLSSVHGQLEFMWNRQISLIKRDNLASYSDVGNTIISTEFENLAILYNLQLPTVQQAATIGNFFYALVMNFRGFSEDNNDDKVFKYILLPSFVVIRSFIQQYQLQQRHLQ